MRDRLINRLLSGNKLCHTWRINYGVLNCDGSAVINYVSMRANYRVLTVYLLLIILNYRVLLWHDSYY